MRRRAWSVFGLCGFGALAACEPTLDVVGNAQTRSACDAAHADAYAGEPAYDANVTLKCPNQVDRHLGKMDARGHIRFVAIGDAQTTCTVVIEKDGYWPVTLSVADICVAPEGDASCHGASFAVDLIRKAANP